MLLGDAAAGRAAGLRGLELLAVGDAAADVEDDLAQGGAHGHFHQAGVVDLAGQGEHLGALALFRADGGEPVRAVQDDRRDAGQGLDVVDDGGLAEQALAGRKGRLGLGLAALALDRGHQGGFLAADESAGAHADLDVEVEAGPEDILAQQAVVLGLFDGHAQALDGQRIFGPDIDVARVAPMA